MSVTELFGEVISSYSTEQAIEDGVLVHPYPKQWPWLLVTNSVHAACMEESRKGRRTYDQALKPLCMDAIMEVQKLMKRRKDCDFAKLEGTVAGDVWIKPNDKGGMTLMTPEDN